MHEQSTEQHRKSFFFRHLLPPTMSAISCLYGDGLVLISGTIFCKILKRKMSLPYWHCYTRLNVHEGYTAPSTVALANLVTIYARWTSRKGLKKTAAVGWGGTALTLLRVQAFVCVNVCSCVLLLTLLVFCLLSFNVCTCTCTWRDKNMEIGLLTTKDQLLARIFPLPNRAL